METRAGRLHLPKAAADALNRASGAVYTHTLITHYRIYRKRSKRMRHWLLQFAGMRLNDYLSRDAPPLLHAHSRDAAQEGFYKACKTAKANRSLGAHYPHHRMPQDVEHTHHYAGTRLTDEAGAIVGKTRVFGVETCQPSNRSNSR